MSVFLTLNLIFKVKEALKNAGFLPGVAVVCLGAACSWDLKLGNRVCVCQQEKRNVIQQHQSSNVNYTLYITWILLMLLSFSRITEDQTIAVTFIICSCSLKIYLHWSNIKVLNSTCTVYREIFACFIFDTFALVKHRANLRLGELINSIASNYIFNTTVSGQIEDGVKLCK